MSPPHRTFKEVVKGAPKADRSFGNPTNDTKDDPIPGSDQIKLRILDIDESEKSLWEKAWELAKRETGWDPPPDFRVGTLSVFDEVKRVHDTAQQRKHFAEEHEKRWPGAQYTYREIYGKVAKWADKFQFVGNIVSTAEPVYTAIPWALIRLCISAAVGEHETYQRMLEGVERVSELLVQYSVMERTYAQVDSELSAALRRKLQAFYVVMLKFEIRACTYFDTQKKYNRTVSGLNAVEREKLQSLRQDVDKAKEVVDHDIALVHSDVTKRGIDDLLEGQNEQRNATRKGILDLVNHTTLSLASQTVVIERQLSESQKRQQEQQHAIFEMWSGPLDALKLRYEDEVAEREREALFRVRNWLSRVEPERYRADAKQKRTVPLGDWLLRDQKFRDWKCSEESSLLWLYGFAGTGKTGLVCRAIDDLEGKLNDKNRLAFFYCSNDKVGSEREEVFSRSDPEEALRSIVSQISISVSENNSGAARIVRDYYTDFGPRSDKAKILDPSDCVKILVAISKDTPFNIVLDALDECDQDKSLSLIQNLKDVICQSSKTIKVFISTRSFPAIESELTRGNSIEVTADNNRDDVRRFIRETLQVRIDQGALLKGNVSPELKKHIEDVLTSRAKNMILYPSLLLEQLCDKSRHDNEDSIRKKLDEMPKDLIDVYGRIMDDIHHDSEHSRRIAQDTFKWLLCAREPLGWKSLLEAISPSESRVTEDDLIRACRTLVVKESGAFEFAHYSVREHVSKIEAYSLSQGHIVATQSCLRILNDFFGPDEPKEGLKDYQKSFVQYALLYWPLHYEGIKRDDLGENRAVINMMLRTFLLKGRNNTEKYKRWFEEVQKMEHLKDNGYLASRIKDLHANPLTPLFAACVFGLEDVIGKFGRELKGLDKCNTNGQTALCLAIENKKLATVKALLSRRFPADVNLLNLKAVQQFEESHKPLGTVLFASALQCAAATGALEIVKFLIGQGAHIDLVAGYLGSPLQAAALKGHQAIVALLLNNGVEPNSQGGYHANALQAAAAGGHSSIVNLLLENKPAALVNTPGGHYGSALMAAVCSGDSDTVWALLEEEADVNVKSKVYGTPLEKALSMGHAYEEIIDLLLDNKAKPDLSQEGNAVHILHQAASHNLQHLAECCLEWGCKIDMVTTEFSPYPRRFGDFQRDMTPLGLACAEGHVRMVEFLLDRGAPFEHDREHTAILWTAASLGHTAVVDKLITRFKAKHRPEEMAQFFEQRPSPRSGHPILFAAASSGKADVVRILLDNGVKYESNWYNATPLLATATFQCPEVTEELLKYHKDGQIDVCINKQARNGKTALWEACANNRESVTKSLLEAGADYSIPDETKGTILHVINLLDNLAILDLVLKKASEDPDQSRFRGFLNARDLSGKTALIDCAERRRLQCLKLLLRYGADYTIGGNLGNTPLHWASTRGFDDVVNALLKKAQNDADTNKSSQFDNYLNQRNKEGLTALHTAAVNDRQSTVQLLLRYGADYTIGGNLGNTPLHWASTRGFNDVVNALLKKAQKDADTNESSQFDNYLNQRNKDGLTALHTAAENDRQSTVQLLLDKGASYWFTDHYGTTALHGSSWRGFKAVVSTLLEHTSKDPDKERYRQFLDTSNRPGKTALMDAAEKGFVDIIALLLGKGADYAILDNNDFTALHYCAARNHEPAVHCLLSTLFQDKTDDGRKFKKFLNQQSKMSVNGASALRDAAQLGHTPIVKLLLSYGADCYCFDEGNRSPLHMAVGRNNAEMFIAVLEEAKRTGEGDRETFRRYVNARDENGDSLWAGVERTGNKDIMKALRECGVEIDRM